jgi:prepilin-type processing-associated H-X9-DG protein
MNKQPMTPKVWRFLKLWSPLCLILFFLWALFSPGLISQVTPKAQETSCMSNFKQLGLALTQYEADNDGYPPPADSAEHSYNWRNALYPDIQSQQTFKCPVRHDQSITQNGLATDYSVNCSVNAFFTPTDPQKYRTGDIPSPAQLIVVCETSGLGAGFDIDNPKPAAFSTRLWTGHYGGSNYLFLDGHAKLFRPMATYNPSTSSNLWYRNPAQPLSAAGQYKLKATNESQTDNR